MSHATTNRTSDGTAPESAAAKSIANGTSVVGHGAAY
jgi:hypothetical protein